MTLTETRLGRPKTDSAKVETRQKRTQRTGVKFGQERVFVSRRPIVANPWLLGPLVGSLNLAHTSAHSPVLELSVSNGCSLSCQPLAAGPTSPTHLLWGPHEMMCAKQLWKASIKEIIFMIEKNPSAVVCPVFKSWTCPFLFVLLEASAYLPQA